MLEPSGHPPTPHTYWCFRWQYWEYSHCASTTDNLVRIASMLFFVYVSLRLASRIKDGLGNPLCTKLVAGNGGVQLCKEDEKGSSRR